VPNELLVVTRHLFRSKFVRELVDLAGEAERKFVTVVHRRAGVAADVKRFIDGHQKRNRVRDRLCGYQLAIGRQYTALYEQYEGFGDDPFIVPVDPNDAPVAFSAWPYAKERCTAIIAELPPAT
jgi:hypothetical protein